jgi:hypothetical protein
MRTAILLTGGLRTFERTASFLLKNLVEPNNATIFVACETASDPTEQIKTLLPNVEVIVSYQPNYRDEEYKRLEEICFTKPALKPDVFYRCGWDYNWSVNWLKYDSGSIVQYYQLLKAWNLMVHYEKTHSIKFYICIRTRFDVLLKEKLELVKFFLEKPTEENEMRSLGNDYMRKNPIKFDSIVSSKTPYYHDVNGTSGTFDNTVWTLYWELVIIAKRDVFEPLSQMINHYGDWDSGHDYSFNSETAFHQYCKHLGYVHYAYEDPCRNMYYSGDVNECPWSFVILR